MKFTFLSLFPNLISSYFKDSILKRAIESGFINIEIINFRKFSKDKHMKVDSPQIGGGAGLLINADVLEDAINYAKTKDSHIIFLTPCAKLFNQNDSKRLSQYNHIIFICGRYEGIDERIIETFVDEVFCIGNYIITGGELASLVLCDSISRNINGVIGNPQSIIGESFQQNLLEAPAFTKINDINKKVSKLSYPSEYSKGNHRKILSLKYKMSIMKTKYFRPDMYKNC